MIVLLSVLILLVLIVFDASGANAEPTSFDLSEYESDPSLYNVYTSASGEFARITTTFTKSELSFVHRYESPLYFNVIRSEIYVKNCRSSDAVPVLRTWINYCADKPLNIDAITFVLNGKNYAFTDIKPHNGIEALDRGIQETLGIVYGSQSKVFLREVLSSAADYWKKKYVIEENGEAPSMAMILHGDEDIETAVPEAFWIDIALLASSLLKESVSQLQRPGTPCEISTKQ